MTEDIDIQIPATEQQIAEAIRLAAYYEAIVIRRLAFERDRLKEEVARLRKEGDGITTHLALTEKQGVVMNPKYYAMLYERMISAGFQVIEGNGV